MLGKNPHIDRAEKAYDRAIHLIRSLDESFQAAAFQEERGERYDTRVTLYQFDLILQAILLNMALIDGNFHRLERRLILKITDYGDLMGYLRREGSFGELSWEGVAHLDEEAQRQLLERLPAILERTCNSFVQPLALVDGAVDSIDFLERLERELQIIADSMSQVDGVQRAEEQQAYASMLEHLLTDRWRAVKADV